MFWKFSCEFAGLFMWLPSSDSNLYSPIYYPKLFALWQTFSFYIHWDDCFVRSIVSIWLHYVIKKKNFFFKPYCYLACPRSNYIDVFQVCLGRVRVMPASKIWFLNILHKSMFLLHYKHVGFTAVLLILKRLLLSKIVTYL